MTDRPQPELRLAHPRPAFATRFAPLLVSALAALPAACASNAKDVSGEPVAADQAAISGVSGPTTPDTPIGLALDVDGGKGSPIQVRAGQRFFVNQIDLRTSVDATTDEGVDGLKTAGDFTSLDWSGLSYVEEEPVLLAGGDGKYTRRRFYREAAWMNADGSFKVEQVDAAGHVVGDGVVVRTGKQHEQRASDDFWDRRYRAIQWTYDCVSPTNCAGAKSFSEEALIELRENQHPEKTFKLRPETAALRLTWSAKKKSPWTIPVTQVKKPDWDYGFSIDVAPVTPPGPGGVYAPGSDVTMQLTLRDGAGKRLHAPGEMPSYDQVTFVGDPAGITYYRAFFDPSTTYYRRKHRERNFIAQIIGPAQDIQAIRTIAPLSDFLDRDVQTVATPAVDGVYAQMRLFPSGPNLFGAAFDPTHAGWAKTVPDTWTWHLPADAKPGTYLVTVKARRVYLGQDIPFTRTVSIQVGTPKKTVPSLKTGGCDDCHSGNASLSTILHANPNRAACAACHVPLGFEYEGPIYVRTHFLHSRSGRYDESLAKCSACHLSSDSIQRTSKSACLSCHTSYPDWHVAKFGKIESMYIGGGAESFQQCTSACHTTHPGSGFETPCDH
jgi:hypothetical protein